MLFKGTDKYGSLDYAKEEPMLKEIEALYEEYCQIDMDDTEIELYNATWFKKHNCYHDQYDNISI